MNTQEQNKFFHKSDLHLEYNSRGTGDKAVLAMHGFGRNLKDFAEFTATLRYNYKIFAVNIFNHGNS